MRQPEYTYDARLVRIVDGDTLDLLVDLGFRVFVKVRVRLYGIDTPETYGVKKDSEEYAKGVAATESARTWLCSNNNRVVICSHDGRALGQGKYGRWLVEVFPYGSGGSLNESLLRLGHAERVEY